jgi:hypothetical protein
MAIPATIWFTIGGISDVKALFKTLATAERDHTDDGRVYAYADEAIPETVYEAAPHIALPEQVPGVGEVPAPDVEEEEV